MSQAEYASNVIPMLQVARRVGATVETIPDDADGVLDVEALRTMLDERVKVVAVTHAPSHERPPQPRRGDRARIRESGSDAWYILDACQSVGQMPLDVDAIGCDLLSATGRKFLRGPRGTGFLALSARALELEPALLDLHAATWVDDQEYVVAEGASRYERGRRTTPRCSASAPPPTTRWTSGSTRRRRSSPRRRTASAPGSPRSRESSCATAARSVRASWC